MGLGHNSLTASAFYNSQISTMPQVITTQRPARNIF